VAIFVVVQNEHFIDNNGKKKRKKRSQYLQYYDGILVSLF